MSRARYYWFISLLAPIVPFSLVVISFPYLLGGFSLSKRILLSVSLIPLALHSPTNHCFIATLVLHLAFHAVLFMIQCYNIDIENMFSH